MQDIPDFWLGVIVLIPFLAAIFAIGWLVSRFKNRRFAALRYHHFDAALQHVPGRVDWSVACQAGWLGFGRETWQVHAADPLVAERLTRAGVIDLIRPLAEARAVPPGLPTVRYARSSATITYSEDEGSSWIPSPERFREQLALLIRLAELNAEANPAGTTSTRQRP